MKDMDPWIYGSAARAAAVGVTVSAAVCTLSCASRGVLRTPTCSDVRSAYSSSTTSSTSSSSSSSRSTDPLIHIFMNHISSYEMKNIEFNIFQVLAFHLSDPLVGLRLRVDHQRPAAAARHDHAVLRREVVGGEALQVPLAHTHGLRKQVHEAEAGGEGQLLRLDLLQPLCHEALAVHRVERARVGQEGRRHQAVAHQVADGHLNELIGSFVGSWRKSAGR